MSHQVSAHVVNDQARVDECHDLSPPDRRDRKLPGGNQGTPSRGLYGPVGRYGNKVPVMSPVLGVDRPAAKNPNPAGGVNGGALVAVV